MLRAEAMAKINWTLDVTGFRADGYHLLDMLMQSVALSDTLLFEPAEALALRLNTGAPVPSDEHNLALKAARALQAATGFTGGVRITLHKRIPVGAGMGGGSADAAAVLLGLDRLWRLGLGHEALEKIGLTVGADVPFMLRGGFARVTGIGEKLAPLPCVKFVPLVIVQPCKGLSTKSVYAAYDAHPADAHARPRTEEALQALLSGAWDELGGAMGNALQPAATGLRPAIQGAVQALQQQGALLAMMTGSGSAVYGVFATPEQAQAAYEALRSRYRRIYLTRTVDHGVALTEEDESAVSRSYIVPISRP